MRATAGRVILRLVCVVALIQLVIPVAAFSQNTQGNCKCIVDSSWAIWSAEHSEGTTAAPKRPSGLQLPGGSIYGLPLQYVNLEQNRSIGPEDSAVWITLNPGTGIPEDVKTRIAVSLINGRAPRVSAQDVWQVLTRLLSDNFDVFAIDPNQLEVSQIKADDSKPLKRSVTVQCLQRYRGVYVTGAYMFFEFVNDQFTRFSGFYLPDIDLEIQPALSGGNAFRLAYDEHVRYWRSASISADSAGVECGNARLEILPEFFDEEGSGFGARLSWRIQTCPDRDGVISPGITLYSDAASGELLKSTTGSIHVPVGFIVSPERFRWPSAYDYRHIGHQRR